jgi:glycerol-3-phosphate dehydrogenase
MAINLIALKYPVATGLKTLAEVQKALQKSSLEEMSDIVRECVKEKAYTYAELVESLGEGGAEKL